MVMVNARLFEVGARAGFWVGDEDYAIFGAEFDGDACGPADADTAAFFGGGLFCGCFLQDGEKESGEEEGAEDIGRPLEVVALLPLGARWRHHYAGVVAEPVEAGFLGKEGLGGRFDGGEVGEVEVEVVEGTTRGRVEGFDGGDGVGGFGGGAAGKVDCGMAGVEEGDEVIAYAGVGAGDYVDLLVRRQIPY